MGYSSLELEVFTLIWEFVEFLEVQSAEQSSTEYLHLITDSRAETFLLPLQYPALSDYYKFILVTIMILVSLTELIRLYLGYVGNLLEKVSYQMYKVISARISAFGS